MDVINLVHVFTPSIQGFIKPLPPSNPTPHTYLLFYLITPPPQRYDLFDRLSQHITNDLFISMFERKFEEHKHKTPPLFYFI